MKIRSFYYLYLLFGLAVLSIIGCGTTRAVVDMVTPGKKDIKKRVMVFPLINHAGFGKASENRINEEFMERLRQPDDFVFQEPFESGPSSKKGESVRFGILLEPEVMARAQGMGLNAAIIGVIQPFEVTVKRSGIWPFRKNKANYEISVAISIVDITDTTLLFTDQESRHIRLDADDVDDRTLGDLRAEAAEDDMPKILKSLAKNVIKALRKERWRGRVLEVLDGRLRINAGMDVGLEPGHRFEVFARGEPITAQGGRIIAVMGEKVGEIRTETVGDTESTAVPVSEGNYEAGQIIRSRP